MTRDVPEFLADAFGMATKERLMPCVVGAGEPVLARWAIQSLVPHRDPFLLLDTVVALDLEAGYIAAATICPAPTAVTEIVRARFVREITPGAELEVMARYLITDYS